MKITPEEFEKTERSWERLNPKQGVLHPNILQIMRKYLGIIEAKK